MQLSPAERAQAVVRYLAKKFGVTQAQIGERIGYTNKSALSAVLNGGKILPKKFGEKLAALDPDININFLAGTSDTMLLSDIQDASPKETPAVAGPQSPATGIYIPRELAQMFSDLSAAVRSQQETIRMLLSQKNP